MPSFGRTTPPSTSLASAWQIGETLSPRKRPGSRFHFPAGIFGLRKLGSHGRLLNNNGIHPSGQFIYLELMRSLGPRACCGFVLVAALFLLRSCCATNSRFRVLDWVQPSDGYRAPREQLLRTSWWIYKRRSPSSGSSGR